MSFPVLQKKEKERERRMFCKEIKSIFEFTDRKDSKKSWRKIDNKKSVTFSLKYDDQEMKRFLRK